MGEQAVVVRPAALGDAEHIAEVRVAAWQTAYRGLIPDDVLDRMDAVAEGQRRRELWGRSRDPRVVELVAELDGTVVAAAVVGPERPVDDERPRAVETAPERGQLYAINAAPEAWRRGVGSALLAAAEDALRAGGFTSAVLWVLEGNERAARFYDRWGWVEDGVTQRDESLTPGHELFERRRTKRLG